MANYSTEFRVGVFVLAVGALVGGSYFWSFDGVRADEASYVLTLDVPAADGLYEGSPVKLAGVEIGSIESIGLAGGQARLVLRVRDAYQLPTDSSAELKAQGLLGDYMVRVYPGVLDEDLGDGDALSLRSVPGDIDTITRNLEEVSEDVAAITDVLREMIEDRRNTDAVESTLANLDALTGELRLMAETNRRDVDAIVDSIRRLSESLEGYTDEAAADIDEEFDKLKELTDQLDVAATDLSSITGKVDRGEGTIGALINDRETIDGINEAIDGVNSVVNSFAGLRTEFYYTGRFYFGSQPSDPAFFYGNPLANSGSNTIGLRLRSHEDFWYLFEINDHPQGVISQTEVFRESDGTVETRWNRELNYRFTFQVEKRWGPMSLRLGIKENGGGIGATLWAFRDRVQVQADVFDFAFGSYPAIESAGLPNTRALVRVEPFKHMYIEAGAEQILLGAKYGYGTGFVGAGFRFNDDDIKLLFATLPLNF
ncbi:MAG: MlaD family protein [Myxococcota bacterium]